VIICVGSLVVGLQVWAGASLATALLINPYDWSTNS
jgi:hypothetical protein